MSRKKKNTTPLLARLSTPKAIKWFWGIILVPTTAVILLIITIALGGFGKLPTFEELENPKNNLATEIYSQEGQVLGSFFIQNRSYVSYEELAPSVVAALIATEDARFYGHSGIDFVSIARVMVKTLAMGNSDQGGGSTITQQLAKNLYPRDTTTYTNPFSRAFKLVVSKFKEWITAVMLEHNYTKEEIIAMYLNTVGYGSNSYGIKSAARTFFNCQPDELKVEQAALLVGVVNAPTRYSPVINPERSLTRRNTVLARMHVNGSLSKHLCDSLMNMPIELEYQPISHNAGTGTYFREMLRQVMTMSRPTKNQFLTEWDYEQAAKMWDENPLYGWCQKNTKADGTQYNLYRDGLKIYTTINATMQQYAEDALVKNMSESVQPRMETQYKNTRVLFIDTEKEVQEQIINNAIRQTDRYRYLKNSGASDSKIKEEFATPTKMRVFSYGGEIDTVLSPRDSILYYKRYMRASFMAMDPSNGNVRAYVGGPNFRYFKYDMVKQGRRQVGSTIKPFIYTFAMDQLGYNPCSPVPNLPVTIETYAGDAWQPKESGTVVYDGEMKPLSWGLANSRNNYSAWIMKQAKQPKAVADMIHKMGIKSYIDPVYALCLGTPDFSLFEMVGAYGTFSNRGVFIEPIFVNRIEDRQGNVLATFTSTTTDAISEQTAYTMTQMLQNVVNAGTAGRLRWMYQFTGEMGGKTGTSQNSSDAWFMGVTPKLVAGAWVGGEDRSVHLLSGGEGASLALPIYAEFMKNVYANKSLGISQDDKFPVPVGGVIFDCNKELEKINETANDDSNDPFFE